MKFHDSERLQRCRIPFATRVSARTRSWPPSLGALELEPQLVSTSPDGRSQSDRRKIAQHEFDACHTMCLSVFLLFLKGWRVPRRFFVDWFVGEWAPSLLLFGFCVCAVWGLVLFPVLLSGRVLKIHFSIY